ncbi:NUDIX hydrolase [Kribbella pittospori]|uniref:NUDIX hydrolase n=1 Tax=Kribbella pittospori TaxID=722689 RepID=A0A4R0KL47_9ACTN|nr:NUDIX hydrolase [Kribbella pittospori]TCC60989.1 NUDIX hydrolase [Kribbella pittospori]
MSEPEWRSAAADSAAAELSRPGDPTAWELVGEELGFHRFLTVKLRRYRLPDGREVEWDVFGPESDQGISAGVTVLPLTPEGRIVTIRMFRAGPDRIVTNLPGGLVEPGEEPALAGARELEEETGYTCETLDLVGWQWSSASSTFRKYIAIARGCRPDGKQSLDETEDCVPVELTVDAFRAELRTPGAMTGLDAAYLALDHAGLL